MGTEQSRIYTSDGYNTPKDMGEKKNRMSRAWSRARRTTTTYRRSKRWKQEAPTSPHRSRCCLKRRASQGTQRAFRLSGGYVVYVPAKSDRFFFWAQPCLKVTHTPLQLQLPTYTTLMGRRLHNRYVCLLELFCRGGCFLFQVMLSLFDYISLVGMVWHLSQAALQRKEIKHFKVSFRCIVHCAGGTDAFVPSYCDICSTELRTLSSVLFGYNTEPHSSFARLRPVS
ncbi:uncharacterized protein J3D65DRAFT_439371 [Phyllosticta citribraziliensis]|uniref:Uncharacterized protein n=1 Tax=Phyllosticta citribraziliensis TaxID=989973 RepID=A0ABR1LIR0_9PEZI